ncbi:MarR family transcriptional regulator [Thermococcus sp. 21S7]|uniref:helix-turn-helix transcriptional regulator n=1 Tax=Thermococcus sp. 21S7 TaxID=1638221 RepID=UPI00143C085E|nr:MarR family transcriptional regulator [Thermococcus sp. 21S7]NJE62044.1 MarR family transcriptional regulator [Thermococcus sp. 21S7]
MRVRILKEECENGKLVLLLKVEIEINSLHKHELGELERQILEFILDNNEVTQKELSKLFGRANTCRAIRNLEDIGLVRRERKGRTYVIRVV